MQIHVAMATHHSSSMHTGRFVDKCSTFGQNDKFTRILKGSVILTVLEASPSLVDFCQLSKNEHKMNLGSLFFPISLLDVNSGINFTSFTIVWM